jgi:hypothetical protein
MYGPRLGMEIVFLFPSPLRSAINIPEVYQAIPPDLQKVHSRDWGKGGRGVGFAFTQAFIFGRMSELALLCTPASLWMGEEPMPYYLTPVLLP